ncbi:MAG: catalase family protein [Deltaproteobacteria bacterium]|nr:catalase family protein [Deltaproteobacteria bacterium]
MADLLPPDPVETPADDEAALAQALAAAIQDVIQQQYAGAAAPKVALRDAHAKIVSLVRGELRVLDDLPASLAHGVFQPGARYRCWVRLSNGDGTVRSDGERDARGLAIKVCGVGEALGDRLPGDTERATQDFLLIDNPTFFVRNAHDYLEFVQQKAAGKSPLRWVFARAPWQWRLKELCTMLRLQRAPTSILAQTFHSMTPYRLGPNVVKLRARPEQPAVPRTDESFDSLRAAASAQLATGAARFAIEVQPRGDRDLSIEDAAVLWPEADAPFHQVAVLELPVQPPASAAQRAFGDRLSFSPWHGLVAHRPLGSLNRMRRAVYPAAATTRHGLNDQKPPFEPTGDEVFPADG